MKMKFPALKMAEKLEPGIRRLFLGAYGFENRSLGWCKIQDAGAKVVNTAWVFKYIHPKGPNKTAKLNVLLRGLGSENVVSIPFDYDLPYQIEDVLENKFKSIDFEEIVLDISSMNKLLILVALCKLAYFKGLLRVIYSEARSYCPTKRQYESYKNKIAHEIALAAKYPSVGIEDVVRLRCLSSIRMQGQPVVMAAFTSFNEKLISHMLGSMSPHRLLLINGRPPRTEFSWREIATQDIHRNLWIRYPADNPVDEEGRLQRVASTLDYRETVERLDKIYKDYGMYERVLCTATGSKMQTVGLLFSKLRHPDIQIEYPSPDSYYVKGFSKGIRRVHEILIPNYSEFVASLRMS